MMGSAVARSFQDSSSTRTWDVTLALGRELGLSSYDASYVGLAQQLGAPLTTRDQQVCNACAHIGVDIWDR